MKKFCVVSHTHWDREWYQPLEIFRLRLVDLIDRCLQTMEQYPDFIFFLDAQTIVIEDYLVIRPGNSAILKQMIGQGRLVVGPWYLQNDFYLTSGESTLRNLLEGIRLAGSFGGSGKSGYAPDQFGNIPQMPQILHEFGLDSFICARGLSKYEPNENGVPERVGVTSEFIWKGADGSEVLAIYMPFWYNNAQRFSADLDRAMRLITTNEESFEGVAHTPFLLLMNGVDHLEAQDDLLPILKALDKRLPEGSGIEQMSMDHYVELIKGYVHDQKVLLPVHEGEMRFGRDLELLKGTLSSRVYLKQANVRAQIMLEQKLEPVFFMLELAGLSGAYSMDHFRYMWKELMKNHPHDSICGCSRDEVHRHMEDNYARLKDTSNEMLRRGMTIAAVHLALNGRSPDRFMIVVANTTELPQTEVLELAVDIPQNSKYQGIKITDQDGRMIPLFLKKKESVSRDIFSPVNLPGVMEVDRYHIQFLAEKVSPFSFSGNLVSDSGSAMHENAANRDETPWIENEYWRVCVDESGRIFATDLQTGQEFHHLIELEDTADPGDSYIYFSTLEQPILGRSYPAEVKLLERSDLRSSVAVTWHLQIPESYDFIEGHRSKTLVALSVTLELILKKQSKVLEVRYAMNNTAKDHRLRLFVRTGIQTDRIVTDIPFDVVSHTCHDHNSETMSKVFPNTSFAALENDAGMAVFTEGNHEVEHFEEEGIMAFTLVRATGMITRNPDGTPGGGEQWACPQNQCLRSLTGRFGVLPYTTIWSQYSLPILAKQFRTGLLSLSTSCDPKKFVGGRPAVQDSILQELFYLPDPWESIGIPVNQSLVQVQGQTELVTAMKKAEIGESLILRMLNYGDHSDQVSVSVSGCTLQTINAGETVLSGEIWEDCLRVVQKTKKLWTVKINKQSSDVQSEPKI